jgi:3-oxoadipate enol-lactonase
MPTITTDDGETLHYVVDGDDAAPPLVLSNSLGTTLEMWDAQVPTWSKDFRLIRYDTRGHGGSSGPAGDYSLARLAQDAINLFDALGLTSVTWCGLSLGGMIGQQLAISAPERLARAVVSNTGAFIGNPDFWNQRIGTVQAEGVGTLADGLIERWFTPEFREAQPAEVARIRAMLADTPADGYCGCCAAIRDMDLRPGITGNAVPLLVIAGTRDPASPVEKAEEIVALSANARLELLDTAHLSNIERPADYARLVLDFAGE